MSAFSKAVTELIIVSTRPLAWDETNLLHMEDYEALPLEENHRLGIENLNARRFFPAHEAWETAWKRSKGTPDEEFFKGLSQLGAGYVHHLRREEAFPAGEDLAELHVARAELLEGLPQPA